MSKSALTHAIPPSELDTWLAKWANLPTVSAAEVVEAAQVTPMTLYSVGKRGLIETIHERVSGRPSGIRLLVPRADAEAFLVSACMAVLIGAAMATTLRMTKAVGTERVLAGLRERSAAGIAA